METVTEKPQYTLIAVYLRDHLTDPFRQQLFKGHQKEEALDIVRNLKAQHGEPRVDFIQSREADVLHFRFKDTPIVGRVVFSKMNVTQRAHCPYCGVAFKHDPNNYEVRCHNWKGTWEFNRDEAMWFITNLTQEVPRREAYTSTGG